MGTPSEGVIRKKKRRRAWTLGVFVTLQVPSGFSIKGFGTERSRLGTFSGFFVSKREETRVKHEVLHEKLKTVVPPVVLKKFFPDPQLHQIFKPIRKICCTFLAL